LSQKEKQSKLLKELGKGLGSIMGNEFSIVLEETLKKEIAEPDFFPQENYSQFDNPCEERAKDIFLYILDEIKRRVQDGVSESCKVFGGCIATHRKESHNDDTAAELTLALESTETENHEIVAYAWWIFD
jgi:hypothetical protein